MLAAALGPQPQPRLAARVGRPGTGAPRASVEVGCVSGHVCRIPGSAARTPAPRWRIDVYWVDRTAADSTSRALARAYLARSLRWPFLRLSSPLSCFAM